MKRLLALSLATAMLALLATSAFAHTQTVLDSDDSEGPLDIVAARHSHKVRDGGRPQAIFRVVTYESWTYESINDTKQFVSFEINLDKDDAIERCVVVRAHTPNDGGALGYSANVYKNCIYFDDELVRSFGTEHVSVPDAHSIRVVVPQKVPLGGKAHGYRWRAVTSFEEQQQNSDCPAPEPHGDGGYGACADFTKWQRHR